jgi:asparagine synthase (glutamine-hydrolysing)
VICTPDTRLGQAIATKAKATNLKLIAVDDQFLGADGQPIKSVHYLGISARKIGESVGQTLAAEMKKRSYPPGETAVCAITFDELATAKERTDGAIAALTAAGFSNDRIFRAPMRASLFSASMRSALNGYRVDEVFRYHAVRAGTDDPLALIQYLDLKTYLVGDINTKVDRASMAHSLEVREPLMDHELVGWLASLPSSFKVRGGEGKYLLKKAMEPHLPHEIMYRPKMGFAVPLARWFRGPLRERVRTAVLDGELQRTGFFDRACLQRMVDDHLADRRDYSQPLWSLMMFEAFLRKVDAVDASRDAAPARRAPVLARVA